MVLQDVVMKGHVIVVFKKKDYLVCIALVYKVFMYLIKHG